MGGDCLHLAHELALTSPNVMLVNGANRQLIGNHWFAGQAKRAIDENLHRRSWMLSAHAYMLNNFGERGELWGQAEDRPKDELQTNVARLGGRAIKFKPDGATAGKPGVASPAGKPGVASPAAKPGAATAG